MYLGLATIASLERCGKSQLNVVGKNESKAGDADEEHDDANSRFWDEYREEERRIERLLGDERPKANRRTQTKQMDMKEIEASISGPEFRCSFVWKQEFINRFLKQQDLKDLNKSELC